MIVSRDEPEINARLTVALKWNETHNRVSRYKRKKGLDLIRANEFESKVGRSSERFSLLEHRAAANFIRCLWPQMWAVRGPLKGTPKQWLGLPLELWAYKPKQWQLHHLLSFFPDSFHHLTYAVYITSFFINCLLQVEGKQGFLAYVFTPHLLSI